MRKLWRLAAAAALAAAATLSAGSVASAAATPGSLDPTFGNGGTVVTNGDGTPADAVLQANGDILVTVGGSTTSGVLRYLPDGKLDTTFGTNGFAPISSSSMSLGASGIAVQANGDILVASGATNSSDTVQGIAVERLLPNGSLDATFGNHGVAFLQLAAGEPATPAIVQESNGDILVGGDVFVVMKRDDFFKGIVARFTSSGAPDTTFGSGGAVTSQALGQINTLGVDPSGDIFTLPTAAEISPTGTLDGSVTQSTIVASSRGGPDTFLSDGNSVQTSTVFIHKDDNEVHTQGFLANGAANPSFASSEIHYSASNPNSSRDSGSESAVEPNGDVVVAGARFLGSSVFGLARFTPTGALDTTFGSAGTVTTDIQGDESVDAGLLVQPNRDIIAVGFTENNSTGVSGVALARYIG
ncbi:MAG: hypothetical protein JO372_03340 [Solirubrobacterales bacterium]|nr:hypothetical protein [Solirubrobacterales bacterium]